MQQEHRNRADGWKYAKLTGHSNESLVKALIDTDENYANRLLFRLGCPNETIAYTSIGGLHETKVPSIIGGKKANSKTDLKIFCKSGRCLNISIKKSPSGQVYLISAERFMRIFEAHFHTIIPDNVVRAINLFWTNAGDSVDIIRHYADISRFNDLERQLKHKSLNADTLRRYDPALYDAMLRWFASNIDKITELSFSKGASADPSEWAEFIWYKNMLGENNMDKIFSIKDIIASIASSQDKGIFYGTTNGGSTIQLPFGFVQWHQQNMQFHHRFDKISNLEQ